jgi:DNA-binding MarR family transcriptional regulator
MSERLLTDDELNRWRNFRFMVEETSLLVSRELDSVTGLTGGQFGILSALADAPSRQLRQQEVADVMRWDRTRLSHQLTRMEANGLVERRKAPKGGTMIVLTALGRREQQRVAPALAKAVRTHFFSKLNKTQLQQLDEILMTLRASSPHDEASEA